MKTSAGDLVSLGRTQPAPFALHWGRLSTHYVHRLIDYQAVTLECHHPGSLMLLATRDHLPLQDTCCAVKLCPRLCPNDDFGGGGSPTKGAQASTESERNVQPWEPFGNFAGRVSVRGVTAHGPARAAGNLTDSSPYPLASAMPKFATPSHRPDKIRPRQRAPGSLAGLSLWVITM